jgi:hypothetical protein
MERLKIFISGKEVELANEREIVRELIRNLGFEPISSESRVATSTPIVPKFIQEVVDSDIYVGIFGKCRSLPSEKEFWTARKSGKERLAFVKEMKVRRDKGMVKFLKRISNPNVGVVYKNFRNVIDLRREVHDAIIETITVRFRKESKGEV